LDDKANSAMENKVFTEFDIKKAQPRIETEADLDRKEYSLSNNNYSHREECCYNFRTLKWV